MPKHKLPTKNGEAEPQMTKIMIFGNANQCEVAQRMIQEAIENKVSLLDIECHVFSHLFLPLYEMLSTDQGIGQGLRMFILLKVNQDNKQPAWRLSDHLTAKASLLSSFVLSLRSRAGCLGKAFARCIGKIVTLCPPCRSKSRNRERRSTRGRGTRKHEIDRCTTCGIHMTMRHWSCPWVHHVLM